MLLALMWGLSIPVTKLGLQELPKVAALGLLGQQVTRVQTLGLLTAFAGIALVALVPWAGWEMAQAPIQFDVLGVGAALYLGLVVTVAGLYMWLGLLRVVPARVAASVQYLQPIFGIAAAALFLGDHLGWAFVLGSLLVLAGLAITLSRPLSH